MTIDGSHSLNTFVCSLDEKGEISNAYRSFAELKEAEPNAKFKCVFEIFNEKTQAVPEEAKLYYETAEEALAHFETFHK